jgi:ubiquinone/menaquinone biosynthesis C-methylase UbiE
MWDPRFVPLLYEDLGITPDMTAVDVGCGTGFMTKMLAKGMKDQGRVVGVDVDERLIETAARLSKEEGLRSVEYMKGDAYHLPLPDRFSDLTVCHMLLRWLAEPLRAVREMRRITKNGGSVVAIDSDASISYDPNDPRLNELDEKFNEAIVRGTFKLDGYDKQIARKLPSILKRAGLKKIQASGYASLELPIDPRISRREMEKRLKDSLEVARRSEERRERDLKYVVAGGMSKREYEERVAIRLERLAGWAANMDRACEDTSLSAGLILVVSGKRLL